MPSLAGVAISISGLFLSQSRGLQPLAQLESRPVAVAFSTYNTDNMREPASATLLVGAPPVAGLALRRFRRLG